MDSNNGRNPTKKRGRPKKAWTRQAFADAYCNRKRNQADMIQAIHHGLTEELQEELLPLTDPRRKESTVTILAYLARFPPEMQREMFPVLQRMGSRAAKRFWECVSRPPSREQIAKRLGKLAATEFPSVPLAELARALRDVAEGFEGQADGDPKLTWVAIERALCQATARGRPRKEK